MKQNKPPEKEITPEELAQLPVGLPSDFYFKRLVDLRERDLHIALIQFGHKLYSPGEARRALDVLENLLDATANKDYVKKKEFAQEEFEEKLKELKEDCYYYPKRLFGQAQFTEANKILDAKKFERKKREFTYYMHREIYKYLSQLIKKQGLRGPRRVKGKG